MTVIVSLVLALMSTGLKSIHQENEAIYNKKAILTALGTASGMDPKTMKNDEIQKVFETKIEQIVVDATGKVLTAQEIASKGYPKGRAEDVDMAQEIKKPESQRIFPIYKYKGDKGETYVLTVRGKGLWDEIWGNIALKDNLSTIVGVDFDHKGETPGLGAEIKDNPAWKKQFIGKEILNTSGEFVSVNVVKGGAKDPKHEVDGISGATITGDGVAAMLDKGLALYQPYFKSKK